MLRVFFFYKLFLVITIRFSMLLYKYYLFDKMKISHKSGGESVRHEFG